MWSYGAINAPQFKYIKQNMTEEEVLLLKQNCDIMIDNGKIKLSDKDDKEKKRKERIKDEVLNAKNVDELKNIILQLI